MFRALIGLRQAEEVALSRSVHHVVARCYVTKVSGYTRSMVARSGRKVYDLRSDTVTTQPKGMLKAMIEAEVGDDAYSEDPTVRKLEDRISEMTGKESAILLASGTASCQIAARSVLPPPPISLICHGHSHIYTLQSMAVSYLCGAGYVCVYPEGRPKNSHLKKEDIENVMFTGKDMHVASTGLVCLENTMNGKIMPLEDAKSIYELCKSENVPVNLDGSRLWNAHAATGISIAEYAKYADNISLCFSKGMCCPIGSVLAGSKETIDKARHYRKLLGGAWRQAGYFAAACLWAIDNILPVLNMDNIKTKILAENFVRRGIPIREPPETNILFLGDIEGVKMSDLTRNLCNRGILIFDMGRIVLHHQIDINDLEDVANVFQEAIEACLGGERGA